MSRSSRRAVKQEGDVRTSGVRVGPEFQAEIPPLLAGAGDDDARSEHKADLLYEPASNDDLEQASEIKRRLGNAFVRWTPEEKTSFKKCLSKHKKKFHRYKDLLPNKSIVHLLDYYYSTKIRDVAAEPPVSRDPDYNPGRGSPKKNGRNLKKPPPPVVTGVGRVLFARKVDAPPSGCDRLRFDLDEIQEVVESDSISKQLKELQATSARLSAELTQNKVDNKDHKQVEMYRRLCASVANARGAIGTPWTDSELILAVHSIRLYGKDFKAVARLIGNKTEAQVRLFFANYRERYNLELMVRQFEEDRRNGLISRGGFGPPPSQSHPDRLATAGSPVKKIIRSPLKKPSILLRRKV